MNSAHYYSMMLVNAKSVSVCDSSLQLVMLGGLALSFTHMQEEGLTFPTYIDPYMRIRGLSPSCPYLHNLHSNGFLLNSHIRRVILCQNVFVFQS